MATESSSSRPNEHDVPMTTMFAPGDSQTLAHDVETISPEGAPADPHSGPGGQLVAIIAFGVIFVVAAVVVGLTFSWVAAVATLGLGVAAAMFNPAVFAAVFRAGERRQVMETPPSHEPPPARDDLQ